MTRQSKLGQDLSTLLNTGALGGFTDRQLLDRFVRWQDSGAEAAFTTLVERHGPMVLGVCRRILDDPHAAEDAFQATFLILVKRAHSLWVADSLRPWLYGVSCRVATRARIHTQRRRTKEGGTLHDYADPSLDPTQRDLRGTLDEELGRLPEKYRRPLILCYLEGFTHEMAAEKLGWPVGTVRGRLARGRERLKTRLSNQGIRLSAESWGPATLAWGRGAELSSRLVAQTTQIALTTSSQPWALGLISTAATFLARSAEIVAFPLKIKAAVFAGSLIVLTAATVPGSLPTAKKPTPGQGDGSGTIPKNAVTPRKRSKTEQQAIDLATAAFGPRHWTTGRDQAYRYYNHERGYWMYAKNYEKSKDGKQLILEPFALIWSSRDGKSMKTINSDRAVMDLHQPFGLVDDKNSTPLQIKHIRIEANVRFRDARGTQDPSDDFVIGPLPLLDCDGEFSSHLVINLFANPLLRESFGPFINGYLNGTVTSRPR